MTGYTPRHGYFPKHLACPNHPGYKAEETFKADGTVALCSKYLGEPHYDDRDDPKPTSRFAYFLHDRSR